MDLASKLKQAVKVEPSADQIAKIAKALEIYKAYIAGGYADDDVRPSDAVRFLRQFKNHVGKVVNMGLRLESKLGPKQSLVPLLKCFSQTCDRKQMMMPDNQEVIIEDYSPALNEYHALLDKLAQLSKGIESEISAIDRTTKKGTTLDPWLMDTISELARVFESITGKPAKRAWDAYQGLDTGLFLSFVETIFDHYGLEHNNSLPYCIRTSLNLMA